MVELVVDVEVALLGEALAAQVAGVGPPPAVHQQVALQLGGGDEPLGTKLAPVLFDQDLADSGLFTEHHEIITKSGAILLIFQKSKKIL